ncbi:MAG: hypothetical protein QF858_03440 [Candidatus Pacebacteria bacterium]|jgi:hypothetical protein|nr:hypothetical protein [bacterium]MDP6527902.1 hypothetical protein [Candidatus Paceibacterota bacterium]MDP6659712.1 hypothetical protein [Candidatus Paceibacterota bacterium]|tara:strand:- start:14591 stop:15841 length:1251 start_codon:yes stop_codon:yes gene_type:complete
MKRTICFTVIYIGELKFFERFFSHFEDEYDIHLLFIRPDDNKRRQMIEYSKENRYTFTVIDYDLGGNRRGEKRIPVVSALIRYRKHIKSARAFFNKHNIGRFVGAKISFTNQTFFREANYRGIQTVLVQRGHRPPLDSYVRIKKLKPLKRTYAFFIDLMRKVIEMITFGPRYAFTSIMPSKVGAIGEEGKTVLPERHGFDPKIISVLGSFEHQWMIDLMKKIKSTSGYRKNILKKYGIDEKKKQILLLSGRYQHYIDARENYTREEELEILRYFEDIVKNIKSVFSDDEIQIHFTLHPAEKNIYEPLKKYGVQIHGIQSKIDELIAVSDLYISYPVTSAAYMAVASGIDAIFINFSPLQELNKVAGDFGITNVVTDREEFKNKLEDFKMGDLERQYDQNHVVKNSIDNTIDFIKSS